MQALSLRSEPTRAATFSERASRAITGSFAFVGVLVTGYLAGAAVADFSLFDQTSGGYEAPYQAWTGTPIDWSVVDVSPQGFVRRGRVLDVLVDCTTGMITIDLIGLRIPFRGFSDRALVVHKPREACVAAGFSPTF